MRRDQAPVQREQVGVFQARRRLVGGGHAQRQVGVAQQGLFDLLLLVVAEADADVREGAVEPPHHVNKDIEDQILSGGDVNLAGRGGFGEGLDQLTGAVEEGEGVRQEPAALFGERLGAARPAALAVQLDVQPPLQRHQPVADALLGKVQRGGGGAEAAVPRQLHEGGHLVRREGG